MVLFVHLFFVCRIDVHATMCWCIGSYASMNLIFLWWIVTRSPCLLAWNTWMIDSVIFCKLLIIIHSNHSNHLNHCKAFLHGDDLNHLAQSYGMFVLSMLFIFTLILLSKSLQRIRALLTSIIVDETHVWRINYFCIIVGLLNR